MNGPLNLNIQNELKQRFKKNYKAYVYSVINKLKVWLVV